MTTEQYQQWEVSKKVYIDASNAILKDLDCKIGDCFELLFDYDDGFIILEAGTLFWIVNITPIPSLDLIQIRISDNIVSDAFITDKNLYEYAKKIGE